MLYPKVAIIILNWNNWKDTIECLESVYQVDYPNYCVVVVDNGSRDNSAEFIKAYALGKIKVKSRYFEYCPQNKPIEVQEIFEHEKDNHKQTIQSKSLLCSKKLILIRNKFNYGFAEGNNIGIRYALRELSPDYVLLLNNDVVVDKKFLTEMIKVQEATPAIGIAGPIIYHYETPNVVNFAGEDLILWKAKGIRYVNRPVKSREVDKVDGACMLIRRKALEDVGLFHPAFFAYWEETDLCMRAKRRGYRLVCIPEAKIWHKIASSFGGLYSSKRIYYMTRNRFLFVKRNVYGFDRVKFLMFFFCWDMWLEMGHYLKCNQFRAIPFFIQGIFAGVHEVLRK